MFDVAKYECTRRICFSDGGRLLALLRILQTKLEHGINLEPAIHLVIEE